MQATLGMPGVGTVDTDACVWEKRRPYTGEITRKPAMASGVPEAVSADDIRCAGDTITASSKVLCIVQTAKDSGIKWRFHIGQEDIRRSSGARYYKVCRLLYQDASPIFVIANRSS